MMDHVYSIVMFCLGAGVLLYAFIVSRTGFDAIPKKHAVDPKDKTAYASEFAKLLAKIAVLFLLSGVIGLLGTGPVFLCVSIAVLVIGFIILVSGFRI